MSPVFAIALLAIRNAIRSRIVVALMLVLILVILLLPLSIKGDGTIEGFVQVLLSYTLGLSGLLLGLNALWAGSASVSVEITDKTLQMIAAKPVTRRQVWLGKWIGLNVLNLILLAMCGAATGAMLLWRLHPDRLASPDERERAASVLSAREVLTPTIPAGREAEARRRLNERLEGDGLPTGVTRADAIEAFRRQVATEENTVRPGGSRRWEFSPAATRDHANPLRLHYRFAYADMGQREVRGRWLIGTPTRPGITEITHDGVAQAINEVAFTLHAEFANQPLIITYLDVDPAGKELIFDPNGGLELLVYRGGFFSNFLRTLLVMLGRLAFYTALGITAGCLFSLPVATFVSLYFFLIIQLNSAIQGMASVEIVYPWQATMPEEAMSSMAILVSLVYKALALMLYPLGSASVLDALAGGRLVSLAWTAQGLFLQGIVYSLLMGALASWILNRRELALPSS